MTDEGNITDAEVEAALAVLAVVRAALRASPIIDAKVAEDDDQSQFTRGLGLHDDSEPILAGLTIVIRDGGLPDSCRRVARAAYDALRATPTAANASEGDGWIEWKGGKCPVENHVRVEVKLRNGRSYTGAGAMAALDWLWANDGDNPVDIIAYRLAAAPTSPDTKEQGRDDVH